MTNFPPPEPAAVHHPSAPRQAAEQTTASPPQATAERVEPAAARGAPAPSPRRPRCCRAFDGPGWIALRVASDAVMLVIACGVALLLAPAAQHGWPLVLFAPLALVLLESRGRYRQRMRDAVGSASPAVGGMSTSAMAVLALMLATGADPATAATLAVWAWLAGLCGVTVTASGLVALQRALRRHGIVDRATLIVGTREIGRETAARMLRMPEYGLRPIGFLEAGEGTRASWGAALPLLGRLDEIAQVVALNDVRSVVVCLPDAPPHEALEIVRLCDELGVDVSVVPRTSAAVNAQTRFEYLGVQPLLNLRAVDRDGWRFGLKHALDRVLAAVALVLLAPLLALLAALVRLSSPGPVLFRQERTGRDGRLFELLKLRTMIEADDAAVYAMYPELAPRGVAPGGVEGIDRRTRVGRLLRRTSLDELPQLVNVLRGEMSLVGPRPERPEFAELFRHEIERYHERHRVRAGLTGWAQVHGSRGQTPLAERVELDNFYIEHWSLALDLKIMLLTLPALLRGS